MALRVRKPASLLVAVALIAGVMAIFGTSFVRELKAARLEQRCADGGWQECAELCTDRWRGERACQRIEQGCADGVHLACSARDALERRRAQRRRPY